MGSAIYFGLLALGTALMLPLAAVGCGIGEGMIFASAIQGIARQPEAAGRIQTGALILAALIEGVALFGAVIAFQIQGKI